MTQIYRCWAEIDRSALRHNAKVVRERIGSAEMLAVVKANAYGHGMLGVAETLADHAQLFGVANLEEALALRQSLTHPIIILGPAIPDERSTIAERGFIPTISTLEEAEDFGRVAARHPRLNPLSAPPSRDPGEEGALAPDEGRHTTVLINFKVDTGNGRMGVVENDAVEVFKRVAALPKIDIHSISTHMPVSNEDADYTRDQLVRFRKIVEQLCAAVPGNYKAHVLQSAGTLAFNNPTFEIVRAGIILYGISPLPEFQKLLKPAMTWKTRIGLVRDVPKGTSISYGRTFITPRPMRVATLTCGYADGYPRHLSNRGAEMLVRGKRCALLGRVTMDLMVIDVSHIEDVEVGEEVVLMGRQGSEDICCNELGEKAGTITWEITTRIGQRVKRVFV
jgi:alanine racemase